MPAVFIGHGSPMNALHENSFTQSLSVLGQQLPMPKAILVISAHWLTEGTWVTGMGQPRTIHDFYGFPDELFAVQYPAPGSPELAQTVREQITQPSIQVDSHQWGLDHGTWAVLCKMYPAANIPVVQLSIDINKPAAFHFELGQKIAFLRQQGVLILGSGNIVHNLRKMNWNKTGQGEDWAIEFDQWVKTHIENKNYHPLFKNHLDTTAGQWSIPTPEHYYPLLTILGATRPQDQVHFHHEGYDLGSISMRGFHLK